MDCQDVALQFQHIQNAAGAPKSQLPQAVHVCNAAACCGQLLQICQVRPDSWVYIYDFDGSMLTYRPVYL